MNLGSIKSLFCSPPYHGKEGNALSGGLIIPLLPVLCLGVWRDRKGEGLIICYVDLISCLMNTV